MPEIIPNLHPALVHFPIALISVSAFFHLAALVVRNKSCAILAHTTLWLGVLAALPAVLAGWQAFNSVNHDAAGHAAMLTHRAWALATLALLALLAAWDAWHNPVEAPPPRWLAGAMIGAWAMVTVTAWHGGELVYRHGLGVMALPQDESGASEGNAPDATHAHPPTETHEAAPPPEPHPAHTGHHHHHKARL